MSLQGIDPFQSNITIASACNHVFRANFLQENKIGIIPNGGYRCNQVQSVEAQKWMKYLELTRVCQYQAKLPWWGRKNWKVQN